MPKVRILEDHKGVVLQGLEEAIVKGRGDIFALLDQVGGGRRGVRGGGPIWGLSCQERGAGDGGPMTTPHMHARPQGSTRRRTAETLLNKQSSRSHSVFIITVGVREVLGEGEEVIRVGKLYLVDLAGSENITRWVEGKRGSLRRPLGVLSPGSPISGWPAGLRVQETGRVAGDWIGCESEARFAGWQASKQLVSVMRTCLHAGLVPLTSAQRRLATSTRACSRWVVLSQRWWRGKVCVLL